MPRHAADVLARLNVRVARGFEGYWKVMLELDASQDAFTIDDIFGRTNGAHRESICDYLRRLCKAGYADMFREDRNSVNSYTLRKRPRRAPRLRRDGSKCIQGAGQSQMWNAMRQLSYFTPQDLVVTASTEEVAVTIGAAKSYISPLLKADYLTVLRPSKPGKQAVYRLKRNTGPRPPQIQRTKFVFDPNLGEVTTRSAEAEEVRS